jgi:RND family efflux transporter MFP subunit
MPFPLRTFPAVSLALAIIAATLTFACSKAGGDTQTAAATAAPPTVAITEVQLRPIAQHLTVSSELVPFQEIDVYAKEAGYVKQLNVDYGSHVREGQVMAVLEIPELEAQLKEDEAMIKARMDEVTRAQQEVARAKAQHDVTDLQYSRLSGVSKTKPGLVAQQEVDDAQGKDLAAASNLDAVKGSRAAANSEVEVAKAKLARDQTLFDYAKITAPFDGVVTQRYANLGALMQAGTSSTQATPLVRLSQENVYRLVIPVPESYVRFVRIGDPVEVKVPSLNETDSGKVARFSADVNSSTRTMHTEVNVANPKGTLVPGLYAEATLTLNQTGNAVTVPIQAIDRTGDQTSVMILQNDNSVQSRPVTLGIQTANYAEVASGLTPGERIVVSDRSGLKAGERVIPHPTEVLAYDTGASEKE